MEHNEIGVVMEGIVSRIKILRLKKNYKQEYMAARMGCSQNSYSKIEVGRTELTVKALVKIASILEVTVFELLKE